MQRVDVICNATHDALEHYLSTCHSFPHVEFDFKIKKSHLFFADALLVALPFRAFLALLFLVLNFHVCVWTD